MISTKEQAKNEFTYLKYADNFKDYQFAYIRPDKYKHFRYHEPKESAPMITHATPISHAQVFKSDLGTLRYDYSHFPANCGIGVYSAVNVSNIQGQYSMTAVEYTNACAKFFTEFVHFIRHHTDRDMIILTDYAGGMVEKLVKASNGEIQPIGESVLNRNSNRQIMMYQTTRLFDKTTRKKTFDSVEVVVDPIRYADTVVDYYFRPHIPFVGK